MSCTCILYHLSLIFGNLFQIIAYPATFLSTPPVVKENEVLSILSFYEEVFKVEVTAKVLIVLLSHPTPCQTKKRRESTSCI